MNYLWWHWAPFNSQYKASTHSLNRTQSHACDLETHFHEPAFISAYKYKCFEESTSLSLTTPTSCSPPLLWLLFALFPLYPAHNGTRTSTRKVKPCGTWTRCSAMQR